MRIKKSGSECPLCGGRKKKGFTTFTADLSFGVVVIKNVPAIVCSQCGEDWISDNVAKELEKTVEDARKHSRIVEVVNFGS